MLWYSSTWKTTNIKHVTLAKSSLLTKLFWLTALVITWLVSLPTAISGVGGFNEWRIRTGHVMSRGLILTGDGNPIYAEYLADGSLGADIAVLDSSLEGSTVISGDVYRAAVNHYRSFVRYYSDGIARGAEILTADDYKNRTFTTINGESVSSSAKSPLLSSNVKSVLVRNSGQILTTSTDPALLQSRINLNNIDSSIVDNSSIKSVLINIQGNVIHSTVNNIGLKSGFFEGEDNKYLPNRGDKIYAPVPGVGVEIGTSFIGSYATTGGDGRFVMNYMLPPCPGFSFNYENPTTATLHFGYSNPKGEYRSVIYPLTQPGNDFCSGISEAISPTNLVAAMTKIHIQGIEASMATPVVDYVFYVDTAVLTGKGYLSNGGSQIPIGETEYDYQPPNLDNIAYQGFDFDGDGTLDTAVLGDVVTKQDTDGNDIEVFESNSSGSLQGIYFSGSGHNPGSQDPELSQPNVVRLADKFPDFSHQGLLKSISIDDLKDTDILIFRESNGMLITARKGLDLDSKEGLNQAGADGNGFFNFAMMLRGPQAAPWDYFGGQQESFSAFQSKADINPALHQRDADHLRPHEKIRVVAINRKTGYIGTVRTNYGSYQEDVQKGEGVTRITANINMRPPNLKIIAEREYVVDKGLSAGDEKEYLIGYEGAALASDKIIKITTEWLDHDGTALPDGLANYGYTGRLAKIVGVNTLGQDSSALANFAIKPGRNTQQVQIGSTATQNEHYYVQVSGESIDGNPTFSTLGAGEGPLQYRPNNYVPILTPIADENMTWKQYLAFRQHQRDNPNINLERPEPIYKWRYRPELQFSLYSFEIDKIYSQASSTTQKVDVYPTNKPVVSSGDSLVEVLYSLLENAISPLEFLGTGQELVLSLGAEEVRLTIGADGQIIFNDLAHLSELSDIDFFAMRLYSNNDAANILWEWAFSEIDIDIDSDNNNEFEAPDRSIEEDAVELIADYSGKFLSLNHGDVNFNGIPDFAEFDYEYEGQPTELSFVPFVVQVPNGIELEITFIKFNYSGSNPALVTQQTDHGIGKTYYVPDSGALRVWTKNANEVRNPQPFSKTGEGNYIVPEKYYRLSDLGFNDQNNRTKTFYIEAILPSKKAGDAMIGVELK